MHGHGVYAHCIYDITEVYYDVQSVETDWYSAVQDFVLETN